jgi:hypothetical protein
MYSIIWEVVTYLSEEHIVVCRAVSKQWLGKHFPAETNTYTIMEVLLETVFSTLSLLRRYKQGTRLELRQLSVGSQAMKSRLGGWCEVAASLRVSQLKHWRSWKGASVQRGLEPRNRKLAIVRGRYQTTTSEDTASWKRLSMILWSVEIAIVL